MAAAGMAGIEADTGAATTEEDVFTTQDTTDTAADGVTSPVGTIPGGCCPFPSRTLTTADTGTVPAMGTATARVRDTGTVIDGLPYSRSRPRLARLEPERVESPADTKGDVAAPSGPLANPGCGLQAVGLVACISSCFQSLGRFTLRISTEVWMCRRSSGIPRNLNPSSWNFICYRSNYPMKKKFLAALLVLVIIIGVVWAKPELLRDLKNWTRSIDGDPTPSLISTQGGK